MADVKLQVEISANTDALENIQKRILELREQVAQLRKTRLDIADPNLLKENAQQIKRLTAEIGVLRVEADKIKFERINNFLQENTKITSQAGIALQSLNFVIRDSPYFFRDFSLGLLAIGNNLNPLIDSMIRAKLEAQALNMTLGQAIMQTLKGPNAVILGFSLLVATIQGLTFALAKSKEKTKEQTEEFEKQEKQLKKTIQAILEYKQALPGYEEIEEARTKLVENIRKREEEIKKLETEIEKARQRYYETTTRSGQFGGTAVIPQKFEETSEYINLKNRILELKLQLENQNKTLTELNKTQLKYTEYTDRINKVMKGEIGIRGEINKLMSATNNEINIYLRYAQDLLDKTPRNTKEFQNLKNLIDEINSAFKENKEKIKDNQKEIEKWIKSLYDAEEQYLKLFQKREKEFAETEFQKLIQNAPEYQEKRLKELLKFYGIDYKDMGEVFSEEMKLNLAKSKAEFEDWLEKVKAKTEYDQLAVRNTELQLRYLREIGGALDVINNKSKNWFSTIMNIVSSLYEISFLSDKMSRGETSQATGTLGIISNVLSIFATFKGLGFFASGGIVRGKLNEPVPIIAHAGEMILNREQQRRLYNLVISGNVSKNQNINLNITGNMKANLSNLIVEFQRAIKIYNNSIKYA